jgi:D-alanyl-D-alanine carboxypeptidase
MGFCYGYSIIVSKIDQINTPLSLMEFKVKKRKMIFNNTNPIIHKEPFEISKTGWIRASGGCIVSKINNAIIIILGSKNTHTRISEVAYLYELHKRRIV